MKYKLTPSFNDDMNDASPIEVTAIDEDLTNVNSALGDTILTELCNDEGIPFGPGFTLTIERIE